METDRFAADVVEKVIRLLRLLADVHVHPFLSPRLVLKGGTALNLFYLDVPRLSVDADMNYLGPASLEEVTAERPSLLGALQAISEAQGYRFRVASDAHASSALILGYRNARGLQDTLKLEVNYMYRVSLGAPQEREARLTLSPPVRFRMVSLAELTGGKLVALLDRTAARDLYDAAALADMVDSGDRFMRRVFVAMGGLLPRRLSEYPVERIERATERDIETNLYPILASTDRPTRDAMLEKVQPWLRQWLALEPEETEFHESLNSGVVRGNLLFPSEPTVANAVERHPGLLWKALNAAKKPRS